MPLVAYYCIIALQLQQFNKGITSARNICIFQASTTFSRIFQTFPRYIATVIDVVCERCDKRCILSEELCSSDTRSARSVKLFPFFRRPRLFFAPSPDPSFFCRFLLNSRLSLTNPSSTIFSTSLGRDRGTERFAVMSPTISEHTQTSG